MTHIEETIPNERNLLTIIISTLPNPNNGNVGIALPPVFHIFRPFYLTEPAEHGQNVGELTKIPYGSQMPGRRQCVTCKQKYPNGNWCGWMHWLDRFSPATLVLDHWYCCMFVGRFYWQRDLQEQWNVQGRAKQRQWGMVTGVSYCIALYCIVTSVRCRIVRRVSGSSCKL